MAGQEMPARPRQGMPAGHIVVLCAPVRLDTAPAFNMTDHNAEGSPSPAGDELVPPRMRMVQIEQRHPRLLQDCLESE